MSSDIDIDLAEMERKLALYVDKGRVEGAVDGEEEPTILAKPNPSLIKPLKRMTAFSGSFLAVDCSTRTLKRANNWGIYLMRAAHTVVKGRDVDWGYTEKIYTAVGDVHVRRKVLQDFRIEIESHVALSVLANNSIRNGDVHGDVRRMYLLLDGGGYFGGDRKFRVSLYEACEKENVVLLAISKNSPSLHDEKGRDFIASTYGMSPYGAWVYHPVSKADMHKHLYGDISIIKLCAESPRLFRCDIMDYLTDQAISELLSPLTYVSEDARCVGYPISLWLAHEFTKPSDSMLLSYYDLIERKLDGNGLLDTLRREELSCSFADEIHGAKYPFQREMVSDYV